jgi:hypothetical protein
MAFAENEPEFRRFERDVLDVYHKDLTLFSRGRPEGRLAVLSAFDALGILGTQSVFEAGSNTSGSRQWLKHIEDGLSQAIRWLTSVDERPSVANELFPELFGEAFRFISHAADYAKLADLHRLCGANLVKAEVDTAAKRIRFRYQTVEGVRRASVGFATSMAHEQVIPDDSSTDESIAALPTSIAYRLDRGMIRLIAPATLQAFDPSSIVPARAAAAFSASADLGGFNMSEFQRFRRGLVVWSTNVLAAHLELVRGGMTPHNCMPTQVVERDTFIDAIVSISQLDSSKIECMIERLSYTHQTRSPCIFQQPLLVDALYVSWSPMAVMLSRADRNMLRLMTRTPELKVLADNLIGGRERKLTDSFGRLLQAKCGWSYKLNQVVSHGSSIGEIDLLGYSRRQPKSVAIVEWKSILSVDEVHEVRAATQELVRAQQQVLRAANILKLMPLHAKSKLYPFVPWNKISNYMPFVATQDVEPNETYDQSVVPCLCVESLRTFGRFRDYRGPEDLARFFIDRPWEKHFEGCVEGIEEIQIGEVTYEIPTLESKVL